MYSSKHASVSLQVLDTCTVPSTILLILSATSIKILCSFYFWLVINLSYWSSCFLVHQSKRFTFHMAKADFFIWSLGIEMGIEQTEPILVLLIDWFIRNICGSNEFYCQRSCGTAFCYLFLSVSPAVMEICRYTHLAIYYEYVLWVQFSHQKKNFTMHTILYITIFMTCDGNVDLDLFLLRFR